MNNVENNEHARWKKAGATSTEIEQIIAWRDESKERYQPTLHDYRFTRPIIRESRQTRFTGFGLYTVLGALTGCILMFLAHSNMRENNVHFHKFSHKLLSSDGQLLGSSGNYLFKLTKLTHRPKTIQLMDDIQIVQSPSTDLKQLMNPHHYQLKAGTVKFEIHRIRPTEPIRIHANNVELISFTGKFQINRRGRWLELIVQQGQVEKNTDKENTHYGPGKYIFDLKDKTLEKPEVKVPSPAFNPNQLDEDLALYKKAYQHFRSDKKLFEAESLYTEYLKRFPSGKFKTEAELDLLELLFAQNKWERFIQAATKWKKENLNHPRKSEISNLIYFAKKK